MNQLLQWNSNLRNHGHRLLSSIVGFASSSSKPRIESLYLKISRLGDPSTSIVPILDQWLEGCKYFHPDEVRKVIKKLHKLHHYSHALQASYWMTERKRFDLSSKDIEIRLDLILKVHGSKKVAECCRNIPRRYPGFKGYHALLNFYANAKQLEKAEATFQIMKDLRLVRMAIPYHTMHRLYHQMGKYEKMKSLSQEMEEFDVMFSTSAFNNRLHAYVACSYIEGIDKLLANAKLTRKFKMDFHSCILAANGYLKAGLFKKTLWMLSKSEKLIGCDSRSASYNTLLALYAAIGNKPDVYRIWKLYNKMGALPNTSYMHMISALLKLDDLDGAEKIYEEWGSTENIFHICIPEMMIGAFTRKGLLEKAEAYRNKIEEKMKEMKEKGSQMVGKSRVWKKLLRIQW